MGKISRNFTALIGTLALLVGGGATYLFYYQPQQEIKHIAAGEVATAAGENLLAIEEFNNALALRPEFVRRGVNAAIRGRGVAHFQDQNYQAALDDFALLPSSFSDSGVLLMKADSHWALEQRDEALDALSAVISHSDGEELTPLLEKRAFLYLALGQRDEALADFAAIAPDNRTPTGGEVHYQLLIEKGEVGAADQLAEELFNSDLATDFVVLAQGRWRYLDHKFRTAVETFNRLENPAAWPEFSPYYALALLALERHQEAREVVEELTNAQPGHPLVLAAAGRLAAIEKDFVVALDRLNRAEVAIADADYPHLLYLRGRTLLENDRPAAALADVEQLLALDPGSVWGLWLRGDIYAARQAFPQASFDFEQALATAPDLVGVLISQSNNYLADGQAGSAAAAVERAAMVGGPTPVTTFLSAKISLAQNQPEKAIETLSSVAAGDQTAEGLALLGHLLLERGAPDDALPALTGSLEIDPAQPAVRTDRAAAFLAIDDFDSALADIFLALQETPENPLLYELKVKAHLAQENLDLAVRTAEQGLRVDPNLAIAHYAIGRRHLERENYLDAVVSLSAAIDLDESLAEAYAARASANYWQRELDRALADASRAVTLNSELAESYMVQALVQGDRQAWGTSLDLADQAVDLDPTNDRIVAQRGEIYLIRGQFINSLDDFNQAIDLDPENAEWYLFKAAALEELQQFNDALAALDEAIARSSRDTTRGLAIIEESESSRANIEQIPQALDGMRVWEDVYHEFSITYPADWRQYVDPGFERPLLLQGPFDKDYRANLLMVVVDEVNLTLPQVALAFDPPATLPDFEVESTRFVRVGRHNSLRKSFRWTASDDRLRELPVAVIQYYTLSQGRLFLITATMRAEDVERYEPIFEAMIASIELD